MCISVMKIRSHQKGQDRDSEIDLDESTFVYGAKSEERNKNQNKQSDHQRAVMQHVTIFVLAERNENANQTQ